MFSQADKKFLLSLARKSIKYFFETGKFLEIEPSTVDDQFRLRKGVFVTLTIDDQLRGCIGHLEATQPLYKDVIENAVNAAFYDPRFDPLTQPEFDKINIEISVLSEPVKIEYRHFKELFTKIQPGKDGIIIKKGTNKATYLPQVWDDLPEKEAFFSSLCIKAGLSPEEWKRNQLEIETYNVEEFEESIVSKQKQEIDKF